MKSQLCALCALISAVSAARGLYELVNDERGYSYLKINEDMDAFRFDADWKSVGNSGSVGVFKYPDGLEGQALRDYIDAFDATAARFSKHVDGGVITIGDVKAGDRYGFYLVRKNGDVVRIWDWSEWKAQTFLEFDKNGGGKDEWIRVGKFSHGDPSGAPLPGSVAVLAAGAAFLAVMGFVRRRMA